MQNLILFGQMAKQIPNQQPGVNAAAAGLGLVMIAVYLIFIVLIVASQWMIFTKAGKPGWASIVPVYNMIVLLQIIGRPIWLVVLLFIPCVNVIVAIVVALDLAKSFGKDAGFAVGMILLPFIFYPILAFGDARYRGPANAPLDPAI